MKAIGNKVIIKVEKEAEQTKAGLFMPEETNKQYKLGEVIAVGNGEKNSPMQVKVGDKILVLKRAGTDVVIDDLPYTVVSQLDVLVIL